MELEADAFEHAVTVHRPKDGGKNPGNLDGGLRKRQNWQNYRQQPFEAIWKADPTKSIGNAATNRQRALANGWPGAPLRSWSEML